MKSSAKQIGVCGKINTEFCEWRRNSNKESEARILGVFGRRAMPIELMDPLSKLGVVFSRALSVVARVVVGTVVIVVGGCGGSDALEDTCVESPDEAIDGFEIEILTGTNGTDCDVNFCIKRWSTCQLECVVLNHLLEDDFESGEFGYYSADFEQIAPGDLEKFVMMNTDCPLFDDAWNIESIFVDAIFRDGSYWTIYDAWFEYPFPEIEEDERFGPPNCDSE